jgi:methylase of polypeptide subunit release factors
MTLKEIKQKYFKQVDLAELDLLVSFVLKKPVEFVLSHPEFKLTKGYEEKIKELIKRRKNGEPLAYIVKKKEFFGLELSVNKNVLIPRPETEILVEEVLDELGKSKGKIAVLDIGTGSGNIIISLSKNLIRQSVRSMKNIKFLATDISKKALTVAKKNAKTYTQDKKIKLPRCKCVEHCDNFTPLTHFRSLPHSIKPVFSVLPQKYKPSPSDDESDCVSLTHLKIKFLLSNLLDNKNLLKEFKNIKKLIIAANLPYVSEKYLKQKETKLTIGLKYEPKTALLGGKDGLDFYKKLTLQILKLKKIFPELKIISFYEINSEQKEIFEKWKIRKNIKIKTFYTKDLNKKWRVCKIKTTN